MATNPVHMTQRRPDQMLDHVDALSSSDATTPELCGSKPHWTSWLAV